MFDHPTIQSHLGSHPHRLLFVTVSGAHLYGFASPDSDFDLRGCHVADTRSVLSFDPPNETHEVMHRPAHRGDVEVDLVTHESLKYFRLLLKNNGYVLEQIFSPLVLFGSPDFDELKSIAKGCITKNHRHHFFHFAQRQWEAVVKSGEPTAKGLLYTYRVLLVGIHLLRTGQVESNLRTLNEAFRLPYIDELVALKLTGPEKGVVSGADLSMHEAEFARLCGALDDARTTSQLPEFATTRDALEDLLLRIRLGFK